MKEPGPRGPFLESPGNFRAPISYTQIQAYVLLNKPVYFDSFPSLREHPVFSAPLSPAFGGRKVTTGNTSAVRRLQLQLSRSTDYRDLRDAARWLSFAKLQMIYMSLLKVINTDKLTCLTNWSPCLLNTCQTCFLSCCKDTLWKSSERVKVVKSTQWTTCLANVQHFLCTTAILELEGRDGLGRVWSRG